MSWTPLPEQFRTAKSSKEAMQAAQRRCKYLLVYLHAPENWRCADFLRRLDADTQLQQLLSEQFFVWGADVDTPEGAQAAADFGATAFPFVAVMVKRRAVMTLGGGLGHRGMAQFREDLEAAMDVGGPEMADEVAFQADRDERETLRRQQEQALEEAMRIDRARAEQKAAERAAREAAEREAKEAAEREAREQAEREAEARRQAEEEERRQMELELRKAQALSAVPEEPGDDCPADEVGTLKIVSANGAAVMRRFHASTKVDGLFAFAESLPDFDGSEYQLVSGFPPKPIDRELLRNTPLREVRGLWPRSVVTVRPLL
uniref:UBX domain-containing protein n=1 Tax=Neobodo designis TaxID=312471 RepID=A0A7S1M9D0_NEODS|mmetsp:Transcript_3649/g.11472  ORF Transcript_3649/g.11472 Transcript_3649/m.11472 type:complete len:318 (+) Transcript_3649:47-1000(+)|eukprot:CAMPEP_0174853088 /NCGR_PEP_ID=MMETSP1114-20130205/27353_1 /TAXON_ID=312471 /ORGANISM="Neobodo designis, Strain CCAP 1951/1" /LENGTH=317 /DNA_ID=CAMNT_0016087709 /DNA_START=45 /DNA_END=998 /DNA_ORIENTATION=-